MTHSSEKTPSTEESQMVDYRFRFLASPELQDILIRMIKRTDGGDPMIDPFVYSSPTTLDATNPENTTRIAAIRGKLVNKHRLSIPLASTAPTINETEDGAFDIGFRIHPPQVLRNLMGQVALKYRYNQLSVGLTIPRGSLGREAGEATRRLGVFLQSNPHESSRSAIQYGRYVNDVRLVERLQDSPS